MNEKWWILIYAVSCYVLAWYEKSAELALFIVCGAIGLAFLFLEKFSEFTGAGFSAKLRQDVDHLKTEVGLIKQVQEEPDIIDYENNEEHLNEDIVKILDCLISGKFNFRTVTGISKSSNLDLEHTLEVLKQMEALDLVLLTKSHSGIELWAASPKGKIYHSIERNSTFI